VDGFESGKLAEFWLPGNYGTGLYAPGSIQSSTNFARSGKFSAELTVREGSMAQPGASETMTERTELDSGHYPLLGKEVCYGFSFLVPGDFPVRNVRLVISSCKQSDVDRPLTAQRYRNGRHTLTVECLGKRTEFKLPKITKGEWVDMIYRVRYAEKDGLVEAWMNGKKVASYQGPLAEPKFKNSFYHKIGLYRDKFKTPMTLYFDNYRTGATIRAVDPALFMQ
jgi:hypothetical protein